jgi:hypothetical protein
MSRRSIARHHAPWAWGCVPSNGRPFGPRLRRRSARGAVEALADLGARNLFDGCKRNTRPIHTQYTLFAAKNTARTGVTVRPSGRVWHKRLIPISEEGPWSRGPVLSAVWPPPAPVYLVPSFTMIDAGGSAHASLGAGSISEPLLHHQHLVR